MILKILFVHVKMLDHVQYMGIVYFQKQFLHCMYTVHTDPGFPLLSIAIHCL